MGYFHIDKPDKFFMDIVKNCFPSYNGRMFKIGTNIPTDLSSYWEGGSKNSFVIYELATGKIADIQTNHPIFEPDNPRKLKDLPVGFIIVKHTIFEGKDMGITIYGNSENINPLLPEKKELDKNEDAVLFFTRSLKPSYGGVSNYRFVEANRTMGITLFEWEETKNKLIEKGFLNKNGAITANGRNAVGDRFNY